MGLFNKAVELVARKYISGKVKDIAMGKLGAPVKAVWDFLSGWKSWIVAIVAVYKLVCVDCASSGYLASGLSALGWDQVTGAFDAKEAAMALGVIVALGHRLWKAIQEAKAGVPIEKLLSPKV